MTAQNKDKTKKLLDLFKKFKFIDPYNTSSWADIVIVCAANGLEPDIDLFWLLTIGSFLSKQVQQMLLHTLKQTNLLDEIASKPQAVEIVYTTSYLMCKSKLTCSIPVEFGDILAIEDVWYTIFPEQPKNDYIDPYYPASTDSGQESSLKKYQMILFKAFDFKFPLAWLKFYSANSYMTATDHTFMKFLLSTTRVKAKLNRQFQPLLAQLEKDVNKHEAKLMHLV